MSKRKWAVCLSSIGVALLLVLFFYNNSTKTTIYIGVPSINSQIHRYDILKKDLESQFDIRVKFVDLYEGLDFTSGVTEQDFMRHVDSMLKNNKVDIIIGLPPHQLEYAIKNDRLLDITDYIININYLHKGVVDRASKLGNGRFFYMSPIFYDIHFVMQNKLIFEALNIDLLPQYVSWEEFLHKLNELEEAIAYKGLNYYPLALGVRNFNDDTVFSSFDFMIHGLGLDATMFEGNRFSDTWANFYKTFATIIARYGKGLEDMEYGRYPKNFIFTSGQYALMLADTFDIDVLLNEEFNKEYNGQVQLVPQPNFPIAVSFINYDSSRTQNIRDSSIAINKNTKHKEVTIDILNFLLSKEYAIEMINTRFSHSHFFPGTGAFPSFYDEDTIYLLNKSFEEFDVGLLYDVDYGSVFYNYDVFNDLTHFNQVLNSGFTKVFNSRLSQDLDIVIEESLEYIEDRLFPDSTHYTA